MTRQREYYSETVMAYHRFREILSLPSQEYSVNVVLNMAADRLEDLMRHDAAQPLEEPTSSGLVSTGTSPNTSILDPPQQRVRCTQTRVARPSGFLLRFALCLFLMLCGMFLGATADERWFTHASPTLYNAATNRSQLSNCSLLTMREDSIEGIYDTLRQCALISKSAGGIGLDCIRGTGAYVGGTNGTSNGLVPILRVYNNKARYVDQSGNERTGAFAIYLEPWHADIFEFLELKKNTGKENCGRDSFYALCIPDLFMKRVIEANAWSLMCPADSPGLAVCWGEEFERLYLKYEKEGRFRKQVKAHTLWYHIPYMLFKDACNRKSNQQNLGTIKCSNLCVQIVQYSSPGEIAVCNLASIPVNMYVRPNRTCDFEKLKSVVIASTAQILGNNESVEAHPSNIYTRRVISGEFQIVNHHFMKDLRECGLLNADMKNEVIATNGAIQNIANIPDDLKALYKTVWELSHQVVIDKDDRGADQSQSLNIHIAAPNFGKLTLKSDLKTGMYYLRTKPAVNAIQFTVEKEKLGANICNNQKEKKNAADKGCSLQNKDECFS